MASDRHEEYERLREMSPAQKLAVMHSLIRQGLELKAAGIRARRPELTEEEVRTRLREIISRERP